MSWGLIVQSRFLKKKKVFKNIMWTCERILRGRESSVTNNLRQTKCIWLAAMMRGTIKTSYLHDTCLVTWIYFWRSHSRENVKYMTKVFSLFWSWFGSESDHFFPSFLRNPSSHHSFWLLYFLGCKIRTGVGILLLQKSVTLFPNTSLQSDA